MQADYWPNAPFGASIFAAGDPDPEQRAALAFAMLGILTALFLIFSVLSMGGCAAAQLPDLSGAFSRDDCGRQTFEGAVNNLPIAQGYGLTASSATIAPLTPCPDPSEDAVTDPEDAAPQIAPEDAPEIDAEPRGPTGEPVFFETVEEFERRGGKITQCPPGPLVEPTDPIYADRWPLWLAREIVDPNDHKPHEGAEEDSYPPLDVLIAGFKSYFKTRA